MSAWQEILKEAKKHGFIVQAYGGAAVLATREEQKRFYGNDGYRRIQKMSGHCPRKWGDAERCDELSEAGLRCEECRLRPQGGETDDGTTT